MEQFGGRYDGPQDVVLLTVQRRPSREAVWEFDEDEVLGADEAPDNSKSQVSTTTSRRVIEDPWNSKPFDVHRWSDFPAVRRLVDDLWSRHFSDSSAAQARRPGPKPKASLKSQLRVVLLDLFVAWLQDPEMCVGVSMNSDAWRPRSRYNALHLSKQIIPIIRRLDEVGLIDRSGGSYNRETGVGNRTTRIRASSTLQKHFAASQITRDQIGHTPDRECIILRDADTDGGGGRQIEYEDTDETNRMRAELEAYNAVLAEAFIDIPSLERPFIEREITSGKAAGKMTRLPIDHHHHFVHRVFSRGNWGLNGRFYGGWWQQIGSKHRAQILINDTPTSEVDFKGMHIAILCAEQGIEPEGDPYELPPNTLPGTDADLQRKLVKRLVLTALNARDQTSAFQSFRDTWPTGHRGKTCTNEELTLLLQTFAKKYPRLEPMICADQGIRLMNIDARIAEWVHWHFTAQGIPVLSVHDSFIIDYTRVLELKRTMQEAARAVVGTPLAVDCEALGLDEVRAKDWEDFVKLDFIEWRQPVRGAGYLERLAAWEDRNGKEIIPFDHGWKIN